MTACDTTISLGAYVLGTLEQSERAGIDAHLRSCDVCRAQLAELSGLPGLLARLSLSDLGEAAPVASAPDALFAKVAAQARAEDRANAAEVETATVVPLRGRRRRMVVSAAAVVVLLAGAVTAAVLVGSSGAPGPGVRTVQSAQGTVHMRVALTSQTEGTALRVTVSGLRNNEHCRLVAIAADGTRELVGRWWATYAGEAQVTGSTSISPSNLSRFILYGSRGQQLVAVSV